MAHIPSPRRPRVARSLHHVDDGTEYFSEPVAYKIVPGWYSAAQLPVRVYGTAKLIRYRLSLSFSSLLNHIPLNFGGTFQMTRKASSPICWCAFH